MNNASFLTNGLPGQSAPRDELNAALRPPEGLGRPDRGGRLLSGQELAPVMIGQPKSNRVERCAWRFPDGRCRRNPDIGDRDGGRCIWAGKAAIRRSTNPIASKEERRHIGS